METICGGTLIGEPTAQAFTLVEAPGNEEEGDEADLPDGFDVFEESDEEGDATDGEDPGDAVIAIVFASWVFEPDRWCISDSRWWTENVRKISLKSSSTMVTLGHGLIDINRSCTRPFATWLIILLRR
jgi:hypothetical protein